jgi:AcrR family transcriptional regulator
LGVKERQERDRETVARAILDAARHLFVTHGYQEVSIRKIAERIEYSPAAIYSYFPSKDDIFYALAEEGFRLLGAAQVSETASADALEDIRKTVRRVYDFSKRQPQYFALVFLDRRVPRIGRESERFAFMLEIKEAIRSRMQRCIDEGIFAPSVEAQAGLRLLLAPVFGLVLMHQSGRLGPNEDTDALVYSAIETTIAGLRAGTVPASHVA